MPEATGDYSGLIFDDRDALVAYMRDNLARACSPCTRSHHPEIEVDGDTATGTWYLQDKVIVEAFKFMLEGAALYERPLRAYAGGLADRPHRLPPDLRGDATASTTCPASRSTGPGVRTHASTD